MTSQRCDAVTASGTRCRCRVAKPNVAKHTVKQPSGYAFGLLCSSHWKRVETGSKVNLRARCHPLLPGGLTVFTPLRTQPGMLQAAGLLTVTHGR